MSTVNYAEALVRPAENEDTLRAAVEALAALGVKAVPPSATIAREAARHRALNISLADAFAVATAASRSASVATFDQGVQRALKALRVPLAQP